MKKFTVTTNHGKFVIEAHTVGVTEAGELLLGNEDRIPSHIYAKGYWLSCVEVKS